MKSQNADTLTDPGAMEIQNSMHALIVATKNGAVEEAYLLHDLKNQLQVVNSALNLIERSVPSASRRADDQATIVARAALEKARGVIVMLTERKTGCGGGRDVTEVDVLLRQMMPLIRVVMGDGVEVGLDCGAAQALAACAARPLENLVINLVLNAREAMSGGGRLDVTTRILDADGLTDQPSLYLAVSDSGAGMDAGIRMRAGYHRVTTRRNGGGGLGLMSIRDFVASIGGRLAIESEKGMGTTVGVHLPL